MFAKAYDVEEFRWRATRPRERGWPWAVLGLWAAAMVAAVVWSPAFSALTVEAPRSTPTPARFVAAPITPSPVTPALAAAASQVTEPPSQFAAMRFDAGPIPQTLPVIPAVRPPMRVQADGPAMSVAPVKEPPQRMASSDEPRRERKVRRSRQVAQARTHRSYERSRVVVAQYRQPYYMPRTAFGGDFFGSRW